MRKGKDQDLDRAVPLTNGSRSGRPKNMRTLWIRIPNTGTSIEYSTSQNVGLNLNGPHAQVCPYIPTSMKEGGNGIMQGIGLGIIM
jgi:hypothetical protein